MQLTISLKMLIILLHRQKVLTRMAVDMAIFPRNTPKMSNALIAVAQTVGAIPLVLDYKEHDTVVAAISHLPHLVASSLVNLVKDSDSPAEP